jgi:hypothetical protein
MDYQTLYKELAICFDNIVEMNHESDTYIKEAINIVVNLTTSDMDNAIDVIVKFLEPLNRTYASLIGYNFTETNLMTFVSVMNGYTKKISETDLTTFVNNIWEDGVPANWIYLCKMIGEDITEWNVS